MPSRMPSQIVTSDEFFNAVTICDQLDFVFDVAICDVIYLTQSKKPIPFENRLTFNPEFLCNI